MSILHHTQSRDGASTPPRDPFGSNSSSPDVLRLMDAVERKSLSDLLAVLKAGVKVNQHADAFSVTALHKACMNSWTEGVQTLLSNGAKVFTKNHFSQTPLHYAACARSVDCMRALLLHEQAHGAQGAVTIAANYRDSRGRTALHDAAEQSSVEIIKMLLKAKASVDVQDGEKETPLHKAAKSCAVPAMLALLNGGASMTARDSLGDSVLSYSLRHNPGGMEALFDSCLVTDTNNFTSKSLEVKFNFIPCISAGDTNQMRCLWSIVEFGHAKLLKHPLCETFLLMKWFKVRKFFYIQFVFYFMYAILTTLLTFNKFLIATHCTSGNENNVNCSTSASEFLLLHGYLWTDDKILPEVVRVTIISIVLSQTTFILFSLMLSLIYTFSSFKFSFWNVLHVTISLLVFLVLPFDHPNTRYWQQHLASVLLLLLWTQCMLLVGQIPACGIYVVMFTRVAGVFVRIFAVYFSLLLAFTFSFHISEHRDDTTDKPLSDVFLTFLKTLTMMIGELDYNEEFTKQLAILPFTSHIIFLLFVILVAIILSNLLVALAVNDVQSLRNSAHLERLIKQMELVYEMEQSFYGMAYLLEHLRLHRFSKYPRSATLYDHRTTSVSMAPYDPQKGNCLSVKMGTHDTCYRRLEKVPIRLANSVLDCLRVRMEKNSLHDRKASTRPRRLKRLRSTEYNNNEDLKDCLKQLESNLSDVFCDRLSEVLTCNAALSARLTAVENELRTLRRSQSYASQAASSSRGVVQRQRPVSGSEVEQRPQSYQHPGHPPIRGPNMDVRECKSLDPRRLGDVLVLRGMTGLGGQGEEGDPNPAEHDV